MILALHFAKLGISEEKTKKDLKGMYFC